MHLDEREFYTIFIEAKTRYRKLNNTEIVLTFKNGWFFTMRAVPVLSSMFQSKRTYLVQVNQKKQKNILSQLSHDDVFAWFGHELAHIVDYENMSQCKLLLFFPRYIFDWKFRSIVEKRANVVACDHGFARELFAIWKKFLEMDNINQWYKQYIINNYRPDWDNIRDKALAQGVTREIYESFK
ncbi:hypothetical protein KC901_03095 [Patescibacteria group bacterium]|nr:hypothetical protein [Patescibacteria group bacterium]